MYIGSTWHSFRFRWESHLTALRKGQHPNTSLQKDWNIYGETSFECIIIECVTTPDILRSLEQQWLDHYILSGIDCYNACRVSTPEPSNVERNPVTVVLPVHIINIMKIIAEKHRRSLNAEVIVALESFIQNPESQ
jgi:hypothetical protein